MSDAQSLFRRHFGRPPTHTVRAPALVELLGSHAEHNEGLALAAAVNQYAEVAVAPRSDGRIELVTDAATAPERLWVSEWPQNPDAAWADCVKGVLAELRKRGVHFSGFSAAVCADSVVLGSLGGGGAQAVGFLLALRRLYPFSLSETGRPISPKRNAKGELTPLSLAEKLAFAKLCQAAGSTLRGAEPGLLGPITALFGKAWHLLNIDFRFLTVDRNPLIGEALVVCETRTGVSRRPPHAGARTFLSAARSEELRAPASPDADSPVERCCGQECPRSGEDAETPATQDSPVATPADIRALCQSGAGKLGAKAFRSVEPKFLEANRSKLSPREYECARHIVADIQRVVAAERALREGDHGQLGQYLFQSHESSRDLSQSHAPEIELLVEMARAHPGCRGARLLNSGLTGATVNLIAHHQAQDFMEHMSRRYAEGTGRELRVVLCQVADGAAP